MVEVDIIDTIPAHIRELGTTLRSADRAEIEGYGFPTNKALWRSYKSSILRRTAMIDGKVAAIWGVCGVPFDDTGRPWLMTSYEVEKISPLKFARIYQSEVLNMLTLFPKLVNWCDARYDKALRLLDIIGFGIGEPEILGSKGITFRRFGIERRS